MAELNEKNKIVIQPSLISLLNGKARLSTEVIDRGVVKPLWFEVDEEYGEYLCSERADAFLIALLSYAMRERCDIECRAPVGEQLLYQIRTYLLPSLVRYGRMLYEPKIKAEMDSSILSNAGGVGTGLSCGVDSLHVVANYGKSTYPGLTLTHLVLNNVGAYYWGEDDQQYDWQAKHARNFCDEYGFKFIQTNSNITEIFPQNHYLTHTYTSTFAVYALQKLWNVYFYGSSGNDFQESFSLVDNDLHDAANYELLSLDVFSTRSLKIYSEGGALNRMDKLRKLVEFPPSYKYLHVCSRDVGPNCGTCLKCRRTLTALDALGALDRYSQAFDIEQYRAHREEHLRWLYGQMIDHYGDKISAYQYACLKQEITPMMKLRVRGSRSSIGQGWGWVRRHLLRTN